MAGSSCTKLPTASHLLDLKSCRHFRFKKGLITDPSFVYSVTEARLAASSPVIIRMSHLLMA